jgi:4-methyl-5(b-hydroxyethyl)-thiazole monophosphate biosynthesis
VAAICAAPGLVASQLPDLRGKRFTCFDGFEDALIAKGAEYVKAPAVSDGNLITGRGAGCAIDFGCEIVRMLKGADAVSKVRHGMMLD